MAITAAPSTILAYGEGAYYSQGGYYSQGSYYSQSYYQPYYQGYYQGTYSLKITQPVTVKGDTNVLGSIAKASGSFVIDDPLDPKNELLYHSFVESPDAKNIYDGIATLDSSGSATIALPDYMIALNDDFRYLATPIGQPMPDLHLSAGVHREWWLFGRIEISIAGGAPNGRVSWQLTGIRHDKFIEDNPINVVVDKGPNALVDKGSYACPECYGAATSTATQ